MLHLWMKVNSMILIAYLINGIYLQLIDATFDNDSINAINYVTKIKCKVYIKTIVYIDYFDTIENLDGFIEEINNKVDKRVTPVSYRIPRKNS